MKNKLLKYINIFIYLIYLVSAIFFIFKKDFFSLFITIGCIVGTFILRFINKKYNELLDNKLYIALVIFIIISSLLGTCYNFYSIKYYDDFLHLTSGALSCVIAWSIFKYFNIKSQKKLTVALSKEIDEMTVVQLNSLCEVHEVTLSSNVKKNELIFLLLFLIKKNKLSTSEITGISDNWDISPLEFTVAIQEGTVYNNTVILRQEVVFPSIRPENYLI